MDAMDLPLVGETGPDGSLDPLGTLARHIACLRIESTPIRDKYISDHQDCILMYLWGSLYERDPTAVNKIQGMIHSFVEMATRTPPVISLKPVSIDDAAPTVLDSMGQPVLLDQNAVKDYIQSVFDIKWKKSRGDRWFEKLALLAKIYGWYDTLLQWDDRTKLAEFKMFPALQWYKDPTEEEVEDAAYIGLDAPMDAEYAKRQFPQLKEAIDASAAQTLQPAASATAFSARYQDVTYQRPVVTLSIFYLRNQEALMTDQEAIRHNGFEARQVQDEPVPQLNAGDPTAPDAGDTDNGGAGPTDSMANGIGQNGSGIQPAEEGNSGIQDAGTMGGVNGISQDTTAPVVTREAMFHPELGEMDNTHPEWPRKLVLRRVILIADKVVEDAESPTTMIPVISGCNVRYPGRPYGQGDPMRVKNQQIDRNSIHATIINHATWFKGPTCIVPRSIKDDLPDGGKNFHMEPNTTYTVSDETIQNTNGKPVLTIDPPDLPSSIPQAAQELDATFDVTSGHAPVLQGEAPSADSSGVQVQQLQSAAMGTASFTMQYLKGAVTNAANTVLEFMQDGMTADDFYHLNRTYPLPVVNIILETWKQSEMDVDVEIANGSIKAQKEATVRADEAAGILDLETARDLLGYDHKVIQQRMNQQLQASAAVAGAPQSGMPQLQSGSKPAQPLRLNGAS